MCLVPGLADGTLLRSDDVVGEQHFAPAWCACPGHAHHDHAPADGAGVTRRKAIQRAVGSAAGLAFASLAAPTLAWGQSPTPSQAPVDLDPGAEAQVVFLGTNGGPVLSPARAQPSSALVVNGITYLVDAGGDVLWQLTKAKIPMTSVRHLFITHYHSDHVAGYPPLALLGWIQTPPLARLDVWGPTGKSMHRSMRNLWQGDIASREFVSGQRSFDDVVFGHDVDIPRGSGRIKPVFEDDNVRINATRVFHGTQAEMPYAYAYRFDIKSGRSAGKSVAFSGDTTPVDSLSRLAQGCDLMVHEAIYLPGIEEIIQTVAPSFQDGLRKHILSTHTDVADIPKVAREAGTRRVVLSHLGPGFTPADVWVSTAQAAAATLGYSVEVAVARDLDTVTV